MTIEVDTTLISGSRVTLPLRGVVDVTINWGDSNTTTVTSPGNISHTYASNGQYTITITGSLEQYGALEFSSPNFNAVTAVTSWGSLGLQSLTAAFKDYSNLTSVPSTLPTTVTSLVGTFAGATSFNGDISGWDTSNVTNMSSMFLGATVFNQPLNSWDVKNVTGTNMFRMFESAIAFNQPLNNWNVSNVEAMSRMFLEATAFDQPLGDWDTSGVIDMEAMFAFASSFNQDLSTWCVSTISTRPANFDAVATVWEYKEDGTAGSTFEVDPADIEINRPVWGTCPARLPSAATNETDEVTTTTARFNGEVTFDGYTSINERGFVYSTTINPTVSDTKVVASGTLGVYNTTETGLTPNTTYYVRAYATNSVGTVYGDDDVFTTVAVVLPSVTTNTTDQVTDLSARFNGEVTNNGGITLSERGFVYGLSPSPNIGTDTKVAVAGDVGVYQVTETGLTPNTTFFVRAFATNIEGTTYGNDNEFATPKSAAPPIVITNPATDITIDSATFNAEIIENGFNQSFKRGFEISTIPGIPYETIVEEDGAFSEGLYSLPITDLERETYYVRAFAENIDGKGFSNEVAFAPGQAPIIINQFVTNRQSETATLNATIDDGNRVILQQGFVYGEEPLPIPIVDPALSDYTNIVLDVPANIVGLNPNKTYYYRVFAENELGLTYGNELSFTTVAFPNVNPVINDVANNTLLTNTHANSTAITNDKTNNTILTNHQANNSGIINQQANSTNLQNE